MNRIASSLLCAIFSLALGCSRSEPAKSADSTAAAPGSKEVAPSASAPANAANLQAAVSPGGIATSVPQPLSGEAADMSRGVKEALQVAATRAVDELTGPNGFQKNLIALPATVEKARPYLKAAGKEDLLNRFSTAINSAAGEAIKQSPAALNASVQSMQLSDVTALWRGQEDAFTRYLEMHARSAIVEKMMPSIRSATEASGATNAFKQITSAIGQKSGGILAGIQAATGVEMPNANFDLDNYVADQTLNNLFTSMAVQEKKLRENPAARSSELLKSVFSRFEKP